MIFLQTICTCDYYPFGHTLYTIRHAIGICIYINIYIVWTKYCLWNIGHGIFHMPFDHICIKPSIASFIAWCGPWIVWSVAMNNACVLYITSWIFFKATKHFKLIVRFNETQLCSSLLNMYSLSRSPSLFFSLYVYKYIYIYIYHPTT